MDNLTAGSDLYNKLFDMNVYDLERLKVCFEYSYEVELENREYLQEILDCIDKVLEDKKTGA